MHEITAQNVSKVIKKKTVLEDINLQLKSGNIYGLMGRNGSGKTMLLRVLSGLIMPSMGKIIVDDLELNQANHCVGRVGLVIENAGLYPEFSGLENLRFLAKAQNKIGSAEIKNAIIRVGLDPNDKKTYRKYSLGMKQRLVIAQAIMERPDFLFLDEPTNALDEAGVKLIRGIIQEEAQRGALVVLASHNKEDIAELTDAIFQMDSGKITGRANG